MKKRILAFALSLSLAVSLAAPAFAAGADSVPVTQPEETASVYLEWTDFVWQYLEEHPEIRENFDADAWFAEEWSYWTKEEYMEYHYEDDFEEAMWNDWVYEVIYYDFSAEEIDKAYDAYLLDAYEARHPGTLDSLKTEDLLALRGYVKTLSPADQLMEDRGLNSEEEVRTSLLVEYAQDRLRVEQAHIVFLSYQEDYPEKWEAFDADAYFADEYSYYDSKEEYMDYWTIFSEEEFVEVMFVGYVGSNSWYWDWEDGNWSYPWYEEQPLTLVINGHYTGITPTAEDGVSYLSGAALDVLLDGKLGLTTGDPVAIRPAAEEAGWDVVWNEWNNQIILLDREKLLQGFLVPQEAVDEALTDEETRQLVSSMGTLEGNLCKQDFSSLDELMNRILAAGQTEPGQTYRTTNTVDFTFTALNSLDGDETYTVTVTAELLARDDVVNVTLTANAAQLLKLLPEAAQNKLAAGLPKVTFQNLSTLLTGCKAQFIWNKEEGKLYWNIPLLSLFDDTISEDAWYCVDVSSFGTVTVAPESWNTAQMLYDQLLADSAGSYWGGEDAYMDFARNRAMINLLAGADAFTRRGSALTWSLNADALGAYMALDSYYYGYDEDVSAAKLFKELDVSVTAEQNGRISISAAVRPDMDAIAAQYTASPWYDAGETALVTWLMNLLDFRFTANVSGTADRSAGTMEFHWKNQLKLNLKSSTTRQKVNTAPLSAPPAGADVVELH